MSNAQQPVMTECVKVMWTRPNVRDEYQLTFKVDEGPQWVHPLSFAPCRAPQTIRLVEPVSILYITRAKELKKKNNRKCYMRKNPDARTFDKPSEMSKEDREAHKRQQRKEQKARAKERKLKQKRAAEDAERAVELKKQMYLKELHDTFDIWSRTCEMFGIADIDRHKDFFCHDDGNIYIEHFKYRTRERKAVLKVGFHEPWVDEDGEVPEMFKDSESRVHAPADDGGEALSRYTFTSRNIGLGFGRPNVYTKYEYKTSDEMYVRNMNVF